MLAKTPLRDQMIAWLETQDPNERYVWEDPHHCACAEFARATDQIEVWLSGPMDRTAEWQELNGRAAYGQRTFGALLKRLQRDRDGRWS